MLTAPVTVVSEPMHTQLHGEGLAGVEEVKKKIDAFMSIVPAGDVVRITVDLQSRPVPHEVFDETEISRPSRGEILKQVIAELKLEGGLSIRKLAARVDVSHVTMWKWSRGDSYVRKKNLQKLRDIAPPGKARALLAQLI